MFRYAGFQKPFTVAELGGGGSCFCKSLKQHFPVKEYTVFDSCPEGIAQFLRKNPEEKAIRKDLLQMQEQPQFDLVFSVGLIEHFSQVDTGQIIRKHFEMTRPGGFVIIFFPTPTLLYRITRKTAEFLNLWQFPDERPLKPDEFRKTADQCGAFLNGYIIRSNFLSQYAAIYKKDLP